jgi:hypothetical protein
MCCQAYQQQTANVLEAVTSAECAEDCCRALKLAVMILNHDDTRAHDENAGAGAIALLTRCFERNIGSRHATCNELYVRVIRLLFRCSDKLAVEAVSRVGADLVSIVLTLTGEDQAKSLPIRSLVDRLANLNVSLHSVEKKELLVRLIHRAVRQDDCRPLVSMAVQIVAGWTQHPCSKRYLLNHPGLVDDILSLVGRTPKLLSNGITDEDDRLRLYLSKLLIHLTWDASSKSMLATKPCFLSTLDSLISLHGKECKTDAQASAIEVLQQLCTESFCRIAVCKHNDGSILQTLLAHCPNAAADKVNCTLLRLISQDTAVFLLKTQSCVIGRLALAARVEMDSVKLSSDAPVLAAQALKRLATYVSVCNSSHPLLLEALVTLTLAKNDRIRFWATQGLHEQSKSSTGRFYMSRAGNAMDVLIGIAKLDSCNRVKSVAIETLLSLAVDATSAMRLAKNSRLLESLASTVNQELSKMSTTSIQVQCFVRLAIQTMLSLACHETTNKHCVAKTFGFVESLSLYGVSRDCDTELKKAALHCVVFLAPWM